MTRSVLLNSATGQLETTQVLPVAALRPVNSFTKVFKTNGVISRKSIYTTSAMTVELYRVELNRNGSGQIATITETDYTRNPAVVVTRTIGRVDGIDNINATGNP